MVLIHGIDNDNLRSPYRVIQLAKSQADKGTSTQIQMHNLPKPGCLNKKTRMANHAGFRGAKCLKSDYSYS